MTAQRTMLRMNYRIISTQRLRSERGTDSYPAKREHGVIGSNLLGSPMSSAAVGEEDDDTGHNGDAGHGEDKLLRPSVGLFGPGRHGAVVGEGPGGVEDGEGSGEHRQDNEGAAEVNTTESHLGQPDSRLYFLQVWSAKAQEA